MAGGNYLVHFAFVHVLLLNTAHGPPSTEMRVSLLHFTGESSISVS